MNANEIKKIAKEVREGRNTRKYGEIAEVLDSAIKCMATDAGNWADKTVTQISNAIEEIRKEVARLKPAEEPKAKTEKKADDSKRKNFGTVMKMMEEEGCADPVLAAIRWFAIQYGKETYATVKCVKGMLERRGYEIEGEAGSITVILNGSEVADITEEEGTVSEFNIR